MSLLRLSRDEFAPPPGPVIRHAIPVGSVILGSLTALAPVIATAPVVPPFGLLMLIAWRLLRNDLWPAWVALPLGVFDDLFSGQPIGSAMTIWTGALLSIEIIDRRLFWRDAATDWAIAAALITVSLITALAFANVTGGATPISVITAQIAMTVFAFPMASRLCRRLDQWRLAQ